jgi:hypothetical protein
MLEKLAETNTLAIQTFVNYVRKFFITLAPGRKIMGFNIFIQVYYLQVRIGSVFAALILSKCLKKSSKLECL